LKEKKIIVVEKLTEREEFLLEMDDFEQKASGNKDRYSGANTLVLEEENKFRAYAAKKIEKMEVDCIELCETYAAETGRLFEIDGVNYIEMIKEQCFGRPMDLSLSLAKLPFSKIKLVQRQQFSGMSVSNLAPAKADPNVPLRRSMYEQDIPTHDCIVRSGGVHPKVIEVMKTNGFYEKSVKPEEEGEYYTKEVARELDEELKAMTPDQLSEALAAAGTDDS